MSGDRPLQVVATAGHVDHGKSSLIVRLTGIDPDRWEEEKRRGLTIDLGFAWTTLPSGREVGFVDVPGHERFVRNMLAGAGPVKLVLFVVAADEGWKPQSEEHLAIVDVLGAAGGVVALTKTDLVDDAALRERMGEVRERLAGTALEGSEIVACSSATGSGIGELTAALDRLIEGARPPQDRGRPRIHVDRSFTIRGAGTVITGTLTGGTLTAGEEVELYPGGARSRLRGLQTHRRAVETARPVSRVAANLSGLSREDVARGDVVARPGQWRPTRTLEARVRPVRGVAHALTGRGAYKLYLGSAESDARLHVYGRDALEPGGSAFARLRLSRPVTTEPGDRFVLRESGRRATVAGGIVLDTDPPPRPGAGAADRLARREAAGWQTLPSIIVGEREVVRAADLSALTGASPPEIAGARRMGEWWVDEGTYARLAGAAEKALASHHGAHPLRQGADVPGLRRRIAAQAPGLAGVLEAGLSQALLASLEAAGRIVRKGTVVRLAQHEVTLGDREAEVHDMVERVRAAEPTPPDITELEATGFPLELIEAACAAGLLVRAGSIVVTPELARRAEELARSEAAGPEGLTVSRFRQALGTTRKYALPLLEELDRRGVTRRVGEVRRLR